MKPNISIDDDKIVIRFHTNSFVILLDEDKVLFNGKRMLTTNIKRDYTREFIKRHNLNKKHKRIKCIMENEQVFIVDIGFDGRIFFLCFRQKEYNEYRGQPQWKASYWNDRKNKEQKFYVTDMKTPVRTWKR